MQSSAPKENYCDRDSRKSISEANVPALFRAALLQDGTALVEYGRQIDDPWQFWLKETRNGLRLAEFTNSPMEWATLNYQAKIIYANSLEAIREQ